MGPCLSTQNPLTDAPAPPSYAAKAGSGAPAPSPLTDRSNARDAARAIDPAPRLPRRPAVTSSSAEVLFFPDPAMPCRATMRGQQCRRGAQCEYAHQPTNLTRLLDVLNSATKTLDVCVFTITCDEIADAIIAASQTRGVDVRVIGDDEQALSKGGDMGRIAESGIACRTDAAKTHMHHKFAIVDGTTLVNGSFNWTRQAVLGNQENVVVTKGDPALVSAFAEEYERMWNQFGRGAGDEKGGGAKANDRVLFFPDPAMPCRATMRGQQCRRGAQCEYAHQPTNLTRLLDVLNSATKTLDVCVFTITCDEIADAIIAASQTRGVDVRVIGDDEQALSKGGDMGRIAESGIACRTDAAKTHMHHKFAIVDGTTLVNGSFNWTRQAVLGNQENVVVTKGDPALVSAFAEEFERMWVAFGRR